MADAQQISDVMKSINAPSGSAGDEAGKATAAGNTLFATGGEIPAEMFEGIGKGMETEFGAYPAMATNKGNMAAAGIMQQGHQDVSGIDEEIAQLAKDHPAAVL